MYCIINLCFAIKDYSVSEKCLLFLVLICYFLVTLGRKHLVFSWIPFLFAAVPFQFFRVSKIAVFECMKCL